MKNLNHWRDLKKIDSGYTFTAKGSNARVVVIKSKREDNHLLIYGGKSTKDAISYINQVADRLKGTGGKLKLTQPPKITNIAVSGSFDRSLQLDVLISEFQKRNLDAEYEPEQFPALILHLDNPKCTFLLFSTGSYVIQGLHNSKNIPKALQNVRKLIRNRI